MPKEILAKRKIKILTMPTPWQKEIKYLVNNKCHKGSHYPHLLIN